MNCYNLCCHHKKSSLCALFVYTVLFLVWTVTTLSDGFCILCRFLIVWCWNSTTVCINQHSVKQWIPNNCLFESKSSVMMLKPLWESVYWADWLKLEDLPNTWMIRRNARITAELQSRTRRPPLTNNSRLVLNCECATNRRPLFVSCFPLRVNIGFLWPQLLPAHKHVTMTKAPQ